MKRNMIVLLMLAALTALSAMGGKPAGAETLREGMIFQLDEVEELSTGSSWEVTLEEGTRAVLEVTEAPDRRGWIDYDGKFLQLGVESKPGISLRSRRYRAVLTLPRLPEELNASSSSWILADMDGEAERYSLRVSSSAEIVLDSLTAKELIVHISSSGEVKIDHIRAETVNADLSSSAELTIEGGEAEYLETSLSSSADMKCPGLRVTGSISLNNSSSSRLEIGLSDTAEAKGSISSSSRLIIHGDPPASRLQNISLSSSAEIEMKP